MCYRDGRGSLVICDKAPVSITITKHAQDNGCTIISTPHDAFMVSRLIFQRRAPVGSYDAPRRTYNIQT